LNNVEKIWRPNDKDIVAGLWPRRWIKAMTGAGAVATLTVSDSEIFPVDLIREVHTVTFSWVPGAAQTNIGAHLVCIDPVTSVILASIASGMPDQALGAGIAGAIKTISGLDFPIMSSESLRAFGTFSAGAAPNQLDIYITGFEYPRGNFQR